MAEWVEEIQKRLDTFNKEPRPVEGTRFHEVTLREHLEGDGYDERIIDAFVHYEEDIATLIAALKVATTALMLTQHCAVDNAIGFICPMCCEPQENGHQKGCAIGEALAQLQSGEFPKEDA